MVNSLLVVNMDLSIYISSILGMHLRSDVLL